LTHTTPAVKLRSARSDAKQFPPHLAKHKAGHAWAWPKNSPAIKEVKAALKNGDAS
jgi:hypothetical protein